MARQGPTSSGGETVVAELSRATVRVGVVLLLVFPALALVWFNLSVVNAASAILLLILASLIDSRAGAMRLAVGSGGVKVVNFFSSHVFALDTVRIEAEQETSPWPADDVPAAMNKREAPRVGALYISDDSSERVRVGVVPSYGGRMGTIVQDLNLAVAWHRG